MTTRRKFLGQLSGAAAAALVAGRNLPAQGGFTPRTKPTEVSPTLWKTHEFEDGDTVKVKGLPTELVHDLAGALERQHGIQAKQWVPDEGEIIIRKAPTEHPTIIRIAHASSKWVQEGHVQAGSFFGHEWLETAGEDLGPKLELMAYRSDGMRAIRFDDYQRGREPYETYTDPDSAGFKRIVRKAESRPPENHFCAYGPVWIMWLKTGEPVELFCSNKSMRYFALHELAPEGNVGRMTLQTKKCVSKSMRFEWYVPTLRHLETGAPYWNSTPYVD